MTTPSREIGLVSCVNAKRDVPAPPANLYTSAYFEKMRAYAEQEHDDWRILSAKHGILEPQGDPIPPYDETLTSASTAERRAWANQVVTELAEADLLNADVQFVIHAGKAYYEELLPLLSETGFEGVRLPTEGLRIGERMAWYNDRI